MKILFTLFCCSLIPAFSEETKPTIERQELIATVVGEVQRPGPIKVFREMNLYAAVISAGGPTKDGSLRRVTVTRNGVPKVYDLNDEKQKVIKVEPADTIEVAKKSLFGR